jgi:creatinine amidohydrolase
MAPRSTRFEHHDWHEVKAMAQANMVVLIPAATVEQHGPHLPCDVDNLIVQYLCDEAAARRPDLCTVAPLIPFGYNEHNMGFPGCITIGEHTLIELYADVAMSFVRMGFKKVLFVNGHGSNPPFLAIACRKVVNATNAHVATLSHWDLIPDALREHRASQYPGGMAHACELETSLYLAIRPDLVQMDKAVKEIPSSYTEHVWMDWTDGPLSYMPHWSALTESGVTGDASVATAETGRRLLERATEEIAEFIADVATRPHRPGRDHHS